MRKVVITATIAMTVFCTAPLVTPAQAFAEQKASQVHVVEEQPMVTPEESLDYIEADAALATYNSNSLDTISKTNSLVGKGAAEVPKYVSIWNKNRSDDSKKKNKIEVKNLTVDQAVTLWMDEMLRHPKNKLTGGNILVNDGDNYAVHLTDGTRTDLRNALIKKLSQGLADGKTIDPFTRKKIDSGIKASATEIVDEVMGYKDYGDSLKHEAAKLYKTKGVVILRGIYDSYRFDQTYYLAKCAVQCAKDMNLAQYANEPKERRDKDISFAVMEWCRSHASYGLTGSKTTCYYLLKGDARGICQSLANFVERVTAVYGIKIDVVGGGNHAINVLKTGGKYYYMDFQHKNDVICHIDSTGYENSPYTPEYRQLLLEFQKMGLPKTVNNEIVTEKVNSASPELKALADTVVAQVEAKDPKLVLVEDGGENVHWSKCYNTALKFTIATFAYDYRGNLDLADRLYDDDIMNGRVGRGEANWQTFEEFSGKGSVYDYWETPYGRIKGTYTREKDHTVVNYKTEDALFKSKRNKPAKNPVIRGKLSNVYVTGN